MIRKPGAAFTCARIGIGLNRYLYAPAHINKGPGRFFTQAAWASSSHREDSRTREAWLLRSKSAENTTYPFATSPWRDA